MSIDQSKAVVLVLLDLSAVFDTTDYDALFSRLEKLFGLSASVLDWFTSYLKECNQRVSIQGVLLLFGFPKRSVLGLASFTMCRKPLDTTAQRYGVKYHLYVDDAQLYVSLNTVNKADIHYKILITIYE